MARIAQGAAMVEAPVHLPLLRLRCSVVMDWRMRGEEILELKETIVDSFLNVNTSSVMLSFVICICFPHLNGCSDLKPS